MRHDQSNGQRRYRHEPRAGIVRRIREIYVIPAGLVVAVLFVMAVSPKYIHAFGTQVKDPGVQNATTSNAGDSLPGLTPSESALFQAGQKAFEASEGVADGLGPRFNMDSCGGCHAQPAVVVQARPSIPR